MLLPEIPLLTVNLESLTLICHEMKNLGFRGEYLEMLICPLHMKRHNNIFKDIMNGWEKSCHHSGAPSPRTKRAWICVPGHLDTKKVKLIWPPETGSQVKPKFSLRQMAWKIQRKCSVCVTHCIILDNFLWVSISSTVGRIYTLKCWITQPLCDLLPQLAPFSPLLHWPTTVWMCKLTNNLHGKRNLAQLQNGSYLYCAYISLPQNYYQNDKASPPKKDPSYLIRLYVLPTTSYY